MLIIWIILTALVGLSISANSETVNLGERVILPCEQECVSDVKWSKIIPDYRVVAQCSNRICNFEEGVQNRVSVSPEKIPLLIFTSAAYTDMGSYECRCDGKPICDVRLTVLVPISVKAAVLDRVILPCYWNTMKDKAQFQWNMKDQMVLHFEDGKLTMGKDFEERFFYSEEGYWEGNLSLIINQVQSSDEGLYRCFVNKDDKGYPHSYILSIENPKDVPYNQKNYFYATVVLAVLFGCMFLYKVFSYLHAQNLNCTWLGKKKRETNELTSVGVSSPEDLSPERKPLNSRESNHKFRLKRRRSKKRPKTWSGTFSMPSSNPNENNETENEDLI
ncbi:uncharacterized protein LOC103036856 [Astyanax mexicanus]|uniref:uncharacterized protein LOC103036856 n=1 Tax=Astyanax mexicanus TaxID=7994 RepID=UPI0020CB4252|nr:uncharacterized protein LOC103036856 [Astyanax mexicanus]